MGPTPDERRDAGGEGWTGQKVDVDEACRPRRPKARRRTPAQRLAAEAPEGSGELPTKSAHRENAPGSSAARAPARGEPASGSEEPGLTHRVPSTSRGITLRRANDDVIEESNVDGLRRLAEFASYGNICR